MPCLARLFPPISPENLENLAHVRRDTCRLRHHTSLCHPVMELDKISTAIATKERSAMAEKSGWVGERKGEMICDTFWVRFQGVLLSDLCVRQLQCVTERGKPKQIQRV